MTFQYDQYGNRWKQTITSGTGTNVLYTFDTTTNRVQASGYTYDALGNVLTGGFHSYTYDAENRMTQVDNGTTASYVYDAFSRRVRSNVTSDPDGGRECVFDLASKCIAQLGATNGAWRRSEIYALGQSIATYLDGTTNFNHTDQIGSTRAQSTVTGAVQTTCTYDPFGSTFNCSGNGNTSADEFTEDEHDAESNLEHTQFRQLNALTGRWMSPDPYAGSADISNPQSLNRYAYVMNNPLTFSDPLGLRTCLKNGQIADCPDPPAGDPNQNDDRPQPPPTSGDGSPWFDGYWGPRPTIYVCLGCRKVMPPPILPTIGSGPSPQPKPKPPSPTDMRKTNKCLAKGAVDARVDLTGIQVNGAPVFDPKDGAGGVFIAVLTDPAFRVAAESVLVKLGSKAVSDAIPYVGPVLLGAQIAHALKEGYNGYAECIDKD